MDREGGGGGGGGGVAVPMDIAVAPLFIPLSQCSSKYGIVYILSKISYFFSKYTRT